jgi:hypothetical protein
MEAPQRSGISGMIESSNVPTLTNSDQTVLSMVPEAMLPIMQEHATAPLIVTRNILPPVPHGLGSSHLQLSHFFGYGPSTATTSVSVPHLSNIYKQKKRGPKKYAAYKKYKCQRVDDCAGSGGHMRCHCTNHPQLQPLSWLQSNYAMSSCIIFSDLRILCNLFHQCETIVNEI